MAQTARYAANGRNQLNRYLEELRAQINNTRRQLDEKETYIKLVEETSDGLRQAYRDIQTVYQLTQNVSTLRQPEQIIAVLFESIRQVQPLAAGAFLRYDKLADVFYLQEDYQLSEAFRDEIRDHQSFAYYRWVIREKRTIVLPEAMRIPGPQKTAFSCVLLPLIFGEQIIGIADLFFAKSPESYSQSDFDVLNILAGQAAVSVENARLYTAMGLKTEVLSGMKNFMSNILESMSSGIIAVDREGKVSLMNKVAEQMFALDHADPVGISLLELLSNAAGATLYEIFSRCMEKSENVCSEIEVPQAGTEALPLEVTCNQLRDEKGESLGAIILLRDLTESHELSKLRKLDNLKDQLISNISHELRTPLTAIKSFSEILLNYNEENEETRREFLTIINSESDRLTRLINNILDLSKLESGMVKWELESLNLKSLADMAADTLQSLLMEKEIKLVRDYPKSLAPVLGDRDKLIQVIVNLMSNAIKFSSPGGKIRITIEKALKEKTTQQFLIRVGVHDEGPGIPEEFLDSVFDKFAQVVQQDEVSKPKGTGLGLAISKEIITHLGGNIWVESTVGRGSSFYFELPVMPEDGGKVDQTYPSAEVKVVEAEAGVAHRAANKLK